MDASDLRRHSPLAFGVTGLTVSLGRPVEHPKRVIVPGHDLQDAAKLLVDSSQGRRLCGGPLKPLPRLTEPLDGSRIRVDARRSVGRALEPLGCLGILPRSAEVVGDDVEVLIDRVHVNDGARARAVQSLPASKQKSLVRHLTDRGVLEDVLLVGAMARKGYVGLGEESQSLTKCVLPRLKDASEQRDGERAPDDTSVLRSGSSRAFQLVETREQQLGEGRWEVLGSSREQSNGAIAFLQRSRFLHAA